MSSTAPSPSSHPLESLRFRYDDAELFGIEVAAAGGGSTGESESDPYLGVLREHLANAVEIAPDVFPSLAALIDRVRDSLMPGERYTAFLSNDPLPQAYCVSGREPHTMILGMTAGLVRLLEAEELRFVIGHEMGHYLLEHNRREEPAEGGLDASNFRTLQRMAEISADRIGLIAANGSVADGVRAMVKTASGVGGPLLELDVRSFLRRLGEQSNADVGDVYATHPLLGVRCRALALFARSDTFAAMTGQRVRGGPARGDIDQTIADWMTESTGLHPTAVFETSVRRHLVWIALRIFIDDGHFTKAKQAALGDEFGHDLADQAIEFARTHGPGPIATKFRDALDHLAKLPGTSKERVLDFARETAAIAGGIEARSQLLTTIERRLNPR